MQTYAKSFGSAVGGVLPSPQGDEPRDEGDEEDAAKQRLHDDERLRQSFRRGEIAESERRQHDEAEVKKLALVVRSCLLKEGVAADSVDRQVDETEHQPYEHEDADRPENRLGGDLPVGEHTRDGHRQRGRNEQHDRDQVAEADEPVRGREEQKQRQPDGDHDQHPVALADRMASGRLADRDHERGRAQQRAPDRTPTATVDELEQEEVRKQQDEQACVAVQDPQRLLAHRSTTFCPAALQPAASGRAAARRKITRRLAPHLLDQAGVDPTQPPHSSSRGHQGRIRSEAAFARLAGAAPIPASSGQTIRYRLDRSGDRKLNRALHLILVTRKRTHPATIAYIERRLQEGKTRREATRCLKRYLARNLYRLLEHGPPLAT